MGASKQAWILTLSLVFLASKAWSDHPPCFILQWGSRGNGDGQFSGPHGIEVDAAGNVYVVDTGNNRIQKFTSDGVFLIKWGTTGAAPGQFNHPHGIGIGPLGNVYVAETGNNRVQKFTSDGTGFPRPIREAEFGILEPSIPSCGPWGRDNEGGVR